LIDNRNVKKNKGRKRKKEILHQNE